MGYTPYVPGTSPGGTEPEEPKMTTDAFADAARAWCAEREEAIEAMGERVTYLYPALEAVWEKTGRLDTGLVWAAVGVMRMRGDREGAGAALAGLPGREDERGARAALGTAAVADPADPGVIARQAAAEEAQERALVALRAVARMRDAVSAYADRYHNGDADAALADLATPRPTGRHGDADGLSDAERAARARARRAVREAAEAAGWAPTVLRPAPAPSAREHARRAERRAVESARA